MEIRASDTEIDLSGSPSELRGIAHCLEALAAGQVLEFAAEAGADPAPYNRMLSGLRVVASGGRVRVAESGSWLVVEGEADGLSAFASWFAFPDDARFPEHGHYEWYPGHTGIAEDSRPLVIGVAKQAEPGAAADDVGR